MSISLARLTRVYWCFLNIYNQILLLSPNKSSLCQEWSNSITFLFSTESRNSRYPTVYYLCFRSEKTKATRLSIEHKLQYRLGVSKMCLMVMAKPDWTLWICVGMHAYVHIYMHCTHTYAYMRTFICMSTHRHACASIGMRMCTFVCVCILGLQVAQLKESACQCIRCKRF